MSEPSGVRGRNRRRAVRSAGPPPEERDGSSATTVRVPVAAEQTVESPTAETTVRQETSSSTPMTVRMGKTASPVDETPAASADNPTVPDHSAEESASTESKNVPKWLLATATAVAAVLVVALLVTSGFFIRDLRAAETRDALRADYVQTAKQAVLNLTTINDQTAKADIDRVLSVASGELKAEYSQRKDAYASVVEQAKVKATGEIIETALESDNTESARVLVAAKQTLTNAGMAEVQTRFYRFRVTVIRGDTGITASQVEFVA